MASRQPREGCQVLCAPSPQAATLQQPRRFGRALLQRERVLLLQGLNEAQNAFFPFLHFLAALAMPRCPKGIHSTRAAGGWAASGTGDSAGRPCTRQLVANCRQQVFRQVDTSLEKTFPGPSSPRDAVAGGCDARLGGSHLTALNNSRSGGRVPEPGVCTWRRQEGSAWARAPLAPRTGREGQMVLG